MTNVIYKWVKLRFSWYEQTLFKRVQNISLKIAEKSFLKIARLCVRSLNLEFNRGFVGKKQQLSIGFDLIKFGSLDHEA